MDDAISAGAEATAPVRTRRNGPHAVIGRLQELVLRSVNLLGDGCRIEQVRSLIEDRFGHKVAFGAVFTTLNRLEERGMVSRTKGVPMSRRGGRAPRLYAIEQGGLDALLKLDRLAQAMATP